MKIVDIKNKLIELESLDKEIKGQLNQLKNDSMDSDKRLTNIEKEIVKLRKNVDAFIHNNLACRCRECRPELYIKKRKQNK